MQFLRNRVDATSCSAVRQRQRSRKGSSLQNFWPGTHGLVYLPMSIKQYLQYNGCAAAQVEPLQGNHCFFSELKFISLNSWKKSWTQFAGLTIMQEPAYEECDCVVNLYFLSVNQYLQGDYVAAVQNLKKAQELIGMVQTYFFKITRGLVAEIFKFFFPHSGL